MRGAAMASCRLRLRLARPGLSAAAACGALLVLLPLVYTLYRAASFGLQNAIEVVWRPLVGELLLNTVLITVTATLTTAVLGTAAAWFTERTDVPGRRLWALCAAAPLAMPAFITSYAWISLSLDLQDFAGALLVITSSYFPLVYLPVAAALRGMDPALEETARSLGCGRLALFTRVVLPQLRPALLGAMVLVALGVLAEFGAFSLLRFRTFTTEIYAEYRTSFDGGGASLFASLLLLLCLLCLLLESRARAGTHHTGGAGRTHRTHYARVDRGVRRAAQRYSLGGPGRWLAALGFAILTIVTLGVPLGMIGYWLTQPGAAAVSPADVSLKLLAQAALASVSFGLAAAGLGTLLALPLAFMLARHPSRIAHWLERTVLLAQGMPGLVIALAVVSLAVRFLLPLYQSASLLIITYATMFLPLALVSARAALMQAQITLEETARSLGLNRWRAWRRVLLPLIGPGLGAAAVMVFISVTTELNATLLLSPIGVQTLATRVWADTSALAFAAAAPYAALLTGISLAASGILFTLLGQSAVLKS